MKIMVQDKPSYSNKPSLRGILDNFVSIVVLLSTISGVLSWAFGKLNSINISAPVLSVIGFAIVALWVLAFVRFQDIAQSGRSLPWPSSFWALAINRLATERNVSPNDLPRIIVVCDDSSRTINDEIRERYLNTGIDIEYLVLKELAYPEMKDTLSTTLIGAEAVYFILTDITASYLDGLRAWATAHSANPVLVVADDSHAGQVPEFIRIQMDHGPQEFWKLFAQATLRGSLWIKRSQVYYRLAALFLVCLLALAPAYVIKTKSESKLQNQIILEQQRNHYAAIEHDSFQPAMEKIISAITDTTYTKDTFPELMTGFLSITRYDCSKLLNLNGDPSVSLWKWSDDSEQMVRKIAGTRPSSESLFDSNSFIAKAMKRECIVIYSDSLAIGDSAAWYGGDVIGRADSTKTNNGRIAVSINTPGGGTEVCRLVEYPGHPYPKEMICIGTRNMNGVGFGISLTLYDAVLPSADLQRVFGTLRRALAISATTYGALAE